MTYTLTSQAKIVRYVGSLLVKWPIKSITKHGWHFEFWEEVRKSCFKTGNRMNPQALYFMWRKNCEKVQQVSSTLLTCSSGSEKLPQVTIKPIKTCHQLPKPIKEHLPCEKSKQKCNTRRIYQHIECICKAENIKQ